MIKLIITALCILCSQYTYSQDGPWNKAALSEHFTLKVRKNIYKINGRDTAIVTSYPALVEKDANSAIGRAFRHNKRRFEYLLQNRTSFKDGLSDLYPDTNKIVSLYLDTLSANKRFLQYLGITLKPFIHQDQKPKLPFNEHELMTVASRFFYCDAVMPDTSIYWHVCIGLNGIKEAQWQKDYTLLEAFCFEAIFHYLKDSSKSAYMHNFISHTKTLKDKYLTEHKNTNGLLEYVRKNSFDLMSKDRDLKDRLLEYYLINQNNLAFRIVKSPG